MSTYNVSIKKLIAGFIFISVIITAESCHHLKHSTQTTVVAKQLPDTAVRLQLVTDQIYCPVDLRSAPDSSGRLFISQLQGKIWIMKNGKILPTPFLDISKKMVRPDTATFDERGLYSMAFDPHFASNKKFYIYYCAPPQKHGDNCKLVVAEFQASKSNPDIADPASEKIIWQTEGRWLAGDGCQLAFGQDGYLYISTGNIDTVKHYDEAQQLNSWLGKILRVDVHTYPYSIPPDNPFVNDPKAKKEIWAYGFRRPWRFSFDPVTHDLFVGEVGDNRLEEIDIIEKGGNYGWPIKEGNLIYDSTLMNMDTTHLLPAANMYNHQVGLAVMGGFVYHGKDIPSLDNKYVFADFNGPVFDLTKNANGEWTRQSLPVSGRPADHLNIFSVGMDQQDELYLLGTTTTPKGFKGAIYKLVSN
jgi:glucose/arabinose dehydrogenase